MKTRRCAVIGYPVHHSFSPRLHHAFAKQSGLSLEYSKLECPPEQFDTTVQRFFAEGGNGLNVTVPHKASAFALAQVLRPRAQQAKAGNTLGCDEHGIWLDNTDGSGFVRDCIRLAIPLRDARIGVIGAGGAVSGLLGALLDSNVASIHIQNRSQDRLNQLLSSWQEPRLFSTHSPMNCDLLIVSVSEGAADLLDRWKPASNTIIYDLNYGERASGTRQWCEQNRRRFHDGFGMLIEQAAESFYLWHGIRPDTLALHQGEF